MAKKDEKNVKDKTSFSKRFKAELKKVVWPTPKQLFNSTAAVIVIVIVTSLIVFALDLAFESLNKYGIDKLKASVANTSSNTSSDETNTDSENTSENATNSETENSAEENTTEENSSEQTENSSEENSNEQTETQEGTSTETEQN